MRALVHFRGEALEVFLHEEEVRELRIGGRDRDEPWRRDHEEECGASERTHAAHERPVACQQDVERRRRERQDDADQPFAQHRERAGDPERERPPEREREHGGRKKERNAHVERVHLSEHHVERRAGQHRRGGGAYRRAEEPVARMEGEHDAGKAEKRSP